MEKKTYNYSTKNIPVPSERNYKLQLAEKIEIFIKRMRWKAIMYDTGCKQNRNVDKYGLKTLHSPKQVKELSAFEKDLIAVVKDIKFRNVRSDFQATLQEDIRLIHNSKKTMTFADKTSNMYQLTKEEHNKLLYIFNDLGNGIYSTIFFLQKFLFLIKCCKNVPLHWP